jgi:hypothetical protein
MEAPSPPLSFVLLFLASFVLAMAEDPYRFYTWNITFGDIYPLGVKQEVRLPVRTRADSSHAHCALCSCSGFELHHFRGSRCRGS